MNCKFKAKDCHRCGEPVFAAEEKRALGRSWHSFCFSCAACGKSLDMVHLEEHRDLDEIYCSGCYRRLFATIAYGPHRGVAALRTTCNCCPHNLKRSSFCVLMKKKID